MSDNYEDQDFQPVRGNRGAGSQGMDQDFQRTGGNRAAGSQGLDQDLESNNWDSGSNQGQYGASDQGQWDSSNQGQWQSQPRRDLDQGYDNNTTSDDQYGRSDSQYDRNQNWDNQRYDNQSGGQQRSRDDQGTAHKPSLAEKMKGTAEKLAGKAKGDPGMTQKGEQRKRGDADF